jgi:hypothetical protein
MRDAEIAGEIKGIVEVFEEMMASGRRTASSFL